MSTKYIIRYKNGSKPYHVISFADSPLLTHQQRLASNETEYKARTEQEAVDWIRDEIDPEWELDRYPLPEPEPYEGLSDFEVREELERQAGDFLYDSRKDDSLG